MPAVAEELRKIGIAVARTDEGFDLPVIDVTHPRFAIAEDAASVASLHAPLCGTNVDIEWCRVF